MDFFVRVFIPGLPIAQPRQRHTKEGRNYTPSQHPVQGFKAAVAYAVKQAYQGPLWDGPVSLELQFWFPRPKSKQWKTRAMLSYWHTTKPDIDNLAKSVKDALTNVLWHDDAQVCALEVHKRVCGSQDAPGVWLLVRQLEEGL